MSQEFYKPEEEAVYEAAELLGKTFIQRKDLFASQLEDGRYVAIKEPLKGKHLVLHLEGHITLGTYMLAPDSTTRMMAFDADGEEGLKDLVNLATKLDAEGIHAYLETSRRGGHLWFFFDRSFEGEQVRAFGKGLMQSHELESVELFPKQGRLQGGPGSIVRLPFGRHKLTGQRYPFIYPDGQLLAPTVREQIHVLSTHQTVPEAALMAYGAYYLECQKRRIPGPQGERSGLTAIERVKKARPLVDFVGAFVDLRPTASGAVGKCPFHDDQHASFGINAKENYWHCFAGCGAGSIIDFWMKWRNLEFEEALTELTDILGV